MTGDDSNPQQQQRYPCPVCGNTFTRPQHVVRHLRSHTGERPYKCKECGDAFARSDLLSRHVNKCHPALANSGPPDSGKHPKRRACENCAHTGSRCDSNSPCSSCVEQHVPCSRMPKAIGNHPTSLPSYADSRSSLPSLNSTVPSFGGHRRNISGSDWSSDSSSRSRSSQYSQPGASGFEFDGTTLDGLSVPRNLSGSSGLPPPWGPSGPPGNQNLDQSTVTPSQVRAMYGGSLPAGYTHPSQYPPLGGGINLPNPASFPTDSYHSFNPLSHYSGAQKSNISSGTGQSGFGTANSLNHQGTNPPPGTGWKDYTGQGQQQQHASYGTHALTSSHDLPVPNGASNPYNYDPMTDFTSQSVQGIPQTAYAIAQHQHQPGAGTGTEPGVNNASPPSGNSGYTNSSSNVAGTNSGITGPSQTRPSLPGLDSFMSATFPPLNTTGSATSPSTVTTNPGMAYLYGRGSDRRGSVASSASAISDSVSTPSSMGFQPPSPSDVSRPTTSSSSVSYGPLPSAFGGLQLRGGAGGNAPDTNSSGATSCAEAPPGSDAGGNGNPASEGGGASDVENNRRLRQLWSSWLATPFSATSEKDSFVMSNGVLTPLNHPSAAGAGNNSSGSAGANPTLSAVPPHMYSVGASPGKPGQIDQMNQPLPFSLQKSVSLPAIRTPNAERPGRTVGDALTPRVHNGQTYHNVHAEELRRYQEACLARETPSLTLAPRVRTSHTPGTDSNTDGEGSNSPSPISLGSSGGGSAQIRGNTLHAVRSNVNTASSTPRPGSSESGGSGESYGQRVTSANAMWHQYGPPAMSEPDPQVAKSNMDLSGQIGHSYGSRPRPSYKRLASQTLGPEVIKRTAVGGDGGGGGGDTDGYDGDRGGDSAYEYEIPEPPPPIPRKRSNSSPTSSNSRPTHMFNSVGFHALPPYPSGGGASAAPPHNSHVQVVHN